MSEVGRTEKDEKIAELEVWGFPRALPGSGRRREETRPGSRGPVRASPCCALAGPGVGGVRPALPGSDKALGRARTLDVRLRLDTTCRLLVSFLVASSHASCWSSFYT